MEYFLIHLALLNTLPTITEAFFPIEKLIMMASRGLLQEEGERKISDEMLIFEPAENIQDIIKRAELTPEEQ